MSDYVTFDARIEPMEWGKSTYTVMRVPRDVIDAIGKTKRVEGELNDHPVNLALTKAPVIDDVFVYTGKSLLKEIGLTPDDSFEARLRAAPDDLVETPDDMLAALRQAAASDAWNALTPGKQRGYLHQITSAKRVETRTKRIAALIAELRQ